MNKARHLHFAEIENYNDNVDKSLINQGSNYQKLKQRKLMNSAVKVRLYKLEDTISNSLMIYRSKYFKDKIKFLPILEPFLPTKINTKYVKVNATPTMSYRTVLINDSKFNYFVKFSYLKKLGSASRKITSFEANLCLYISDALRDQWKRKDLRPIWDECYLEIKGDRNYRSLIRKNYLKDSANLIMPIASYINLMKKTAKSDMSLYYDKVLPILQAYLKIAKDLFDQGISLEAHGQNLLIECDPKSYKFKKVFRYRDFSCVAICRKIREKNAILSTTEKERIITAPHITEEYFKFAFWKKLYVDMPSTFIYPVFLGSKDSEVAYRDYFKMLKQVFAKHSEYLTPF